MKFTTKLYDSKKSKISTNNIIFYSSCGIILIQALGVYIGILPSDSLFNPITITCVIIPVIIIFLAFFRREEMTKKQVGVIEINPDRLKWNEHEIPWDDIEEIFISYFDFQDDFIYRSKGDFGNRLSNGLDNIIKIKLFDSTNYEGNFLLKSKDSIKELKSMLWEVLKKNNISLDNARRMINPENYKEHQEVKKYCS